jgi:hypothetical protein
MGSENRETETETESERGDEGDNNTVSHQTERFSSLK